METDTTVQLDRLTGSNAKAMNTMNRIKRQCSLVTVVCVDVCGMGRGLICSVLPVIVHTHFWKIMTPKAPLLLVVVLQSNNTLVGHDNIER